MTAIAKLPLTVTVTLRTPSTVPPLCTSLFDAFKAYLMSKGATQVTSWVDNEGYQVTFPTQQAYNSFVAAAASVLAFLATNFPIQGSPWALINWDNFALLNAGFIILWRWDGSVDAASQASVNMLEDFDGGYSHAGIMANQTQVFQVSPSVNQGFASLLDLGTVALSYPGSIWAFPLTGINTTSLSEVIQQRIKEKTRYDGYEKFNDDFQKLFLRMIEVIAEGKLYSHSEEDFADNQYICSSLVAGVLIDSNNITADNVCNWYLPVDLINNLPTCPGVEKGAPIPLVCQQNTYPISLPPQRSLAVATMDARALHPLKWNFL
eukprot:TRINITY_DN634_c0_g2_i1.p1 TRINITY_DN634_c0_g2~~TRINITY_DN634_c0_g2_i1.p1  ORF type:complete len:321 (-),score=52.13 TRINITY_DN634_c0_g2_i1:79-1041(-)